MDPIGCFSLGPLQIDLELPDVEELQALQLIFLILQLLLQALEILVLDFDLCIEAIALRVQQRILLMQEHFGLILSSLQLFSCFVHRIQFLLTFSLLVFQLLSQLPTFILQILNSVLV